MRLVGANIILEDKPSTTTPAIQTAPIQTQIQQSTVEREESSECAKKTNTPITQSKFPMTNPVQVDHSHNTKVF